MTERRGRVVNAAASYSGRHEFKSRPADRLSWLRLFVFFLSPSRKISGYYLKLGHHRFLLNSYQFIIRLSIHLTLQSLSYWKSDVKEIHIWDFGFSQRRVRRWEPSGIYRRFRDGYCLHHHWWRQYAPLKRRSIPIRRYRAVFPGGSPS
jgi:hypothetical protein